MKFIKLELRKNSCKPYFIASIGIFVATLLFTALFASIQYIEPEEALRDNNITNSSFVLTMGITIAVVSYTCLAAVMNSKFILESYNRDNIFLTLSYPVKRKKILSSKFFLVSLFSSVGFVITVVLTAILFMIINNTFNIMNDKTTVGILISKLPMLVVSVIFIISTGIFSLLMGWRKKSIPIVIVTSVIASSIFSNLAGLDSLIAMRIFSMMVFVFGMISLMILSAKVNKLEVK